MKYLLDHNISQSFLLWFDDHLLRNGEAFETLSSRFVKVEQTYKGYNSWKAAARPTQFAFDNSVSGVYVPSGFYINGQFSLSGVINFDKAELLIPESINATGVSGSYTKKDFEVRVTSEQEEIILFGQEPELKFGAGAGDKIPDSIEGPYVYLKYNPGRNTPLCFGGMNCTDMEMRAIVVADSSFLLDGIMSVFRDSKDLYFPLLEPEDFPLNEFGALKNVNYHYRDKAAAVFNDPEKQLFIKEVSLSPFAQKVNSAIAKNAVGAFIDFDLEYLRHPHKNFK